jgi:predicted nuclease with TOPRIM domain
MKKITFLLFFGLFLSNSCTVVDPELIELIQEINNQNKALLDQVKSLQAKSDSLIEELKKSDAKQAGLTERIINLQGELAKVLSQMNTINQQLQKQGADLIAINALLADLQKKYEEIVTQLTQLQRLSQILLEIESLKKQLTDLDGKYQVVATTLGQNQQALDALKTQIAALQTQMNQNITRINQLTTQLGEQGVDMDKVLAEIEALKKSTEELKAKIDEILKGKSPVPTTGLVAWYPFNGNANDESGKGNNGIVSGATLTTDRFNTQNRSYRFRGFGFRDHIRVPFSASLSNQGSFSFSLFFLLENGALMNGNGGQGGSIQSGAILTREGDGIGTSPGFFSEVKITNGQIRAGYYFSEGCCTARTYSERLTEFTVPNLSLNTWVHLAVTVSATEYKIFINGELKLTKPLNSNLNVLNNLDYYLGIFGSGRANLPTWYPFLGKIDDVAIYNRILTLEEVNKISKEEKF